MHPMHASEAAEIVACIGSLRRYARGLTGHPERADDLVQDTLERAWRKLSLWRRHGEVRAWMFGIMHNLFIDRLRSERSRPEDSAGDDLPEVAQRATQPDRLELRDLERALQRLSAEHREVLLLVGLEDLSYQEVAGVVGVPIGTVMSRLSRARERLRAELQGSAAPTRIQRVK